MNKYRPSTLAVALLSFLLTASITVRGSDDQVNERIPVRPSELEAHWGVDCTALWSALKVSPPACPLAGETLRALELCGFIYQAPGDERPNPCPNFRAALDHGKNNCETLMKFVRQHSPCTGVADPRDNSRGAATP